VKKRSHRRKLASYDNGLVFHVFLSTLVLGASIFDHLLYKILYKRRIIMSFFFHVTSRNIQLSLQFVCIRHYADYCINAYHV